MKKIISVFQRNYDGDRLIRNEVVPGAEWVLAGEGIATRKLDGTSCMMTGGKLYKRYDAKQGKTPPPGFIAAQDPDPVTGHWPGWIECQEDNPADRWHMDALQNFLKSDFRACVSNEDDQFTLEALGPKFQGNPEQWANNILIPHNEQLLKMDGVPRTFDSLKEWLKDQDIEGIVFHHPDGRMAKVKKKDFGLPRRPAK